MPLSLSDLLHSLLAVFSPMHKTYDISCSCDTPAAKYPYACLPKHVPCGSSEAIQSGLVPRSLPARCGSAEAIQSGRGAISTVYVAIYTVYNAYMLCLSYICLLYTSDAADE